MIKDFSSGQNLILSVWNILFSMTQQVVELITSKDGVYIGQPGKIIGKDSLRVAGREGQFCNLEYIEH